MAKGILAVAFPRHGALPGSALEIAGAAQALSQITGEPFSCALIGGLKAGDLAPQLASRGPAAVHLLSDAAFENFSDETYSKALASLIEKEGFKTVLVPSSVNGRLLAARLAVALKAGVMSDVWGFEKSEGGFLAKRNVYGGNWTGAFVFKSERQVVAIEPMAFEAPKPGSGQAPVSKVQAQADPSKAGAAFASFAPQPEGEVDLGGAERIVSGGRGLGNPEGFKLIREFAQALGAAVGASRVAVDSGWIPYRHQVGLTGRTVRPKLYVACGISGQIQHLAGMSSSANIVALNTDPECPMMKMASISVVGDLYEMIPLVVQEIKKRRGG